MGVKPVVRFSDELFVEPLLASAGFVARGKEHAFAVVPIVVVGFKAPNGIQRLEPTLVFTLVKLREFAV